MSGQAVVAGVAAQAVRVRWLGRIGYAEAMRLQEEVLRDVTASATAIGEILVLEHEPVYTLGRGADEADLMGAPQRFGVPVFRVGRGGGATFHGPGQVVAYPIVRLPGGGRDVQGFVRRLERSLVATCTRHSVLARAVAGQTGVWTAAGKIGAIGIGVKRGVAYHGVALNVCNRLDYFENIVPCRIPGMAVTTLAGETGKSLSVEAVGDVLVDELCLELGMCPTQGTP